MESEFLTDSLTDTPPVDPGEASRILGDINRDQTAVRSLAVPPRWLLGGASAYFGALVAIGGIPEYLMRSTILMVMVLAWAVAMSLYQIFGGTRANSGVGPRGVAMIPMIVLVLVATGAAFGPDVAREFLGLEVWWPLWLSLPAGIAMAGVSYLTLRWSWRRWVRRGNG